MRTHATRHGHQEGFSLIELMLAIVVLAIAMGAVAVTLGTTLRHTQQSTGRSVASGVVAEAMEEVRQQARASFTSVPEGTQTTTESVDGVTYTVTRTAEFVSQNSTTDACADSDSSRAFLRIKVVVTWPGMGGTKPANAETVLTPPVGAYDPTKGHLSVRVRDRDSEGQENVRVRLMNGATLVEELTTSAEGCAFFSYVTPGAYTVTIDRSAHVDGQNVAVPSATVNIAESAVASREFDYDERAALYLTRVDSTGGSANIPTNLASAIGHPSLLPGGFKIFPHSGGASQWISHIYPYAEGYTAWAGSCADADPESQVPVDPIGDPGGPTTARYPGATRGTPNFMLPGYFTPSNLPLASVELEIVRANGDPDEDEQVRLVHDPDPTSCTTGETLTYATSAVSDSNGRLKVAMPLGRWRVEVLGESPKGGSWPEIQIDPPYNTSHPVLLVETTS